MGYASYLVYLQVPPCLPRHILTVLYGVHLVLLNSWGFCFFTLRRMDTALDVMVTLDVILTVLLVGVSMMVPFAVVLCLPYFCWLLELTYLNMYMFRNNDQQSVREWGASKERVLQDYALGVADEKEE